MLSATRRVVEGVWLGRAGQGAVLASYILAEAAVLEGKPAIGMPEFGAERRGAPVRAFNRIVARPLPGDANILPRTPISLADFLVVMDPHLVSARHLVPSLREGAVVVVNTSRTPQETSRLLGVEGVRVFVVNATEMALRHVGRAVVNTTLLGSLAKATEVVGLESLKLALARRFGGPLLEKNTRALEAGYREVEGA